MMKINSVSQLIPTSTATFQRVKIKPNKQTSAGANSQPAELHGPQILYIHTTNTQLYTQICHDVLLTIEEASREND